MPNHNPLVCRSRGLTYLRGLLKTQYTDSPSPIVGVAIVARVRPLRVRRIQGSSTVVHVVERGGRLRDGRHAVDLIARSMHLRWFGGPTPADVTIGTVLVDELVEVLPAESTNVVVADFLPVARLKRTYPYRTQF